ALRRDHEGDADAGVATGGLDDGAAGLELARLFRLLDHRDRNAILDGREGIEGLELDDHLGRSLVRYAMEPHQRGVADQFRDVVVDLSVLHAQSSDKRVGY